MIFLQNAVQFHDRYNQNEGINCYGPRFLEIDHGNKNADLIQNFQNNEYNQNVTSCSPFFAIEHFFENCGYLNLKLIKKQITELV